MAGLEDLLRRASHTASHARAKLLAKNDYKLLAELVRVRKENGLTQDDVAERLGISQQAVSKLESYDSDPRLSTLRRYAHAIGAVVDHTVERDNEQLAPVANVFMSHSYALLVHFDHERNVGVTANRTYAAAAPRRIDLALGA